MYSPRKSKEKSLDSCRYQAHLPMVPQQLPGTGEYEVPITTSNEVSSLPPLPPLPPPQSGISEYEVPINLSTSQYEVPVEKKTMEYEVPVHGGMTRSMEQSADYVIPDLVYKKEEGSPYEQLNASSIERSNAYESVSSNNNTESLNLYESVNVSNIEQSGLYEVPDVIMSTTTKKKETPHNYAVLEPSLTILN